MARANRTYLEQWVSQHGYLLAIVCLLAGITAGWFIPGWRNPVIARSTTNAGLPGRGSTQSNAALQDASAPLKGAADTQAAPLLKQLQSDPNSPELLANLGNLYYDAQQYATAIGYYRRVLQNRPSDAAVRTDMATAYWYTGDADTALAEFNRALVYEPNKASTLFNLGLVKWKAKMDAAGAVADWENLLASHPNYEGRDKVVQMIAEAKQNAATKPKVR